MVMIQWTGGNMRFIREEGSSRKADRRSRSLQPFNVFSVKAERHAWIIRAAEEEETAKLASKVD